MGRTLPVSTSTSTSAKQTPWTPRLWRSCRHWPWAVTPAAGSAAQACFHESDFPPNVTLPPAKAISSGFAFPSSGAIFSARARRVLMAASLTEGDKDAAVVEPPDELAAPSFELPI